MASRPDLPTASWLAFFEELDACKVMKVALSGGEPFMRQDLLEILEGIILHKMRFSLTTNATLISEEMAHYLKSCRRLEIIQVSIEGSRAEIHERLRGRDSFEAALRGLKLLIAAGLPVAVRVTATPYNLDDLKDICSLLLSLSIKFLSVSAVAWSPISGNTVCPGRAFKASLASASNNSLCFNNFFLMS